MKALHEPVVSPDAPMPKGYGFLKKGNTYMTALCRRKTHEAKKTLYVVMNRTTPEGLRAPKWILSEVFAEEQATRVKRRVAVEKRDAATQDVFEASILKLFPKIPKKDVAMILRRALQKRSGRVGRTGKLELDQKAHLAVQAHVRHCHTSYDGIMRKTKDRASARRAVHADIMRVLAEWGGEAKAKASPRRGHQGAPRRNTKDLPLPPSRENQRRRANSLKESRGPMASATRREIYKPSLKQTPKPRQTLGRAKTGQQQPGVVVDLTDDNSSSRSEISSDAEYQESDEDDLYELSDGCEEMDSSDW